MKYIKFVSIFLTASILISFCGCSLFNKSSGESENESSVPEEFVPVDPNWPVSFYGNEISAKPENVAVASPAIAEYLFDMKLLGDCSALCDYCSFGPEAESFPSIGSVSIPDMEKIKEILPDYILTFSQYEESTLIDLQQLDISVIIIDKPESISELEELYRNLAAFFLGAVDGKASGESYVSEYEELLNSATYSGEKKSAALLRIMDYTMITGDNIAGELFSLGFNNPAAEYSDFLFPEDKWDSFDPDILFVDSDIHIIDLENSDIYKKRAAVKSDSVFGVDIDSIALGSKRSVEILKTMLATAYDGYTSAEALSPAYPSKYKS